MMIATDQLTPAETEALLEAQSPQRQRNSNRGWYRDRHTNRVLLVVGLVVLAGGIMVAVNVIANSSKSDSSTMSVMSMDARDSTPMMDSKFGWGSISNGWCSFKAATYCIFKSDRDQCMKDMACTPSSSTNGTGSGSGSGSVDVGDVAGTGIDDSSQQKDDSSLGTVAPVESADQTASGHF